MNRFISRTTAHKLVNGATVFLLALAVRLLYCFVLAPRQLCGLNDKINFDAASAIGLAMKGSSDLENFAHTLSEQFVGSVEAIDALLRQGPLYAFYLSGLMHLFGLKPEFDPSHSSCAAFVVANIVVGALTCVLIYYSARIAFTRTAATIAAFIAIIYPPAVLNALHCYPENLGFFLVSAWLCLFCGLLLRHETWPRIPAYFAIGAVSGAIVLCTPGVMIMPPLAALLLVLYKFEEPLGRFFSAPPQAGLSVLKTAPTAARAQEAQSNPVQSSNAAQSVEGQTASTAPEVVQENFAPEDFADGVEIAWQPIQPDEKQETEKAEASVASESNQSEQVSGSDIPFSQSADSKSGLLPDTASRVVATNAKVASTDKSRRTRRVALAVITSLAGFALIIGPWLWLEQKSTTTIDLYSEPIVASRLWLGNLLASDGWRILPGVEFPFSSVRSVFHNILNGMMSNPAPYVALFLQKLARLWCGGWNDYALSYFGLGALAQNVFQSLLIFCSYLGFCFVTLSHRRWRHSRMIPCAVVMATVFICHSSYCLFAPCSRNNLTAMPAIIALAGFGIERLLRQPPKLRRQALIVLVVTTMFFAWLASGGTLIATTSEFFATDTWARIADVGIVLVVWLFVAWLVLPIVQDISGSKISAASDMVKLGCFVALLVTLSCGYSDDRWREWKCDIKNQQEFVEQQLQIHSRIGNSEDQSKDDNAAFILVDLESPTTLPPTLASINGVLATEPAVPWLELKSTDPDTLNVLQTQAEGMGKDWRTFRQWWAIPVSRSVVKFDAVNVITVSFADGSVPTTYKVYGEYGSGRLLRNDSYKMMPSPSTVSWEKGFASYESGDLRLIESLILQGKVTESALDLEGSVQKSDLSLDHGRQTGQYRVRLVVPESNVISWAPIFQGGGSSSSPLPSTSIPLKEQEIFSHDDAIVVNGGEAKLQNVTPTPVELPNVPGETRYLLHFDMQSLSSSRTGSVTVELVGTTDDGNQMHWVSPWMPRIIPISNNWQSYSFCNTIPDAAAQLKDLKISVAVNPEDNARELLHPGSSGKQSAVLKKVSLRLLPPLKMPGERERDWVLF